MRAPRAPGCPRGTGGQALLDVEGGRYTQTTVKRAFRAVDDFESDLLCKPWYFGTGDVHVPDNTDRTIVPQGDRSVQKEGCSAIAALPGNHLAEIRAADSAR